MPSALLLFLLMVAVLCGLYTQCAVFRTVPAPSAESPVARPETPEKPYKGSTSRRPREKSEAWQQEYPISPHRNRLVDPYSPYPISRYERRVLKNVINAGEHRVGIRRRRRKDEREAARTSDESFQAERLERADPSLDSYYSDISEPFEDFIADDSFAALEAAPFLSEEEGDYSQYPIIDVDDSEEEDADNVDGTSITFTPRQRAIRAFQRKGTPSMLSNVIDKGSDKAIRGRRRERLERQRSRGVQKSVAAVNRQLDFSPHHIARGRRRDRSEASLELPHVLRGRSSGSKFAESDFVRSSQQGKKEDEEVNDKGVQSVRNRVASINSRIRSEQ